MKSSAKNISLSSYDDIFQTGEQGLETTGERIVNLSLSELHDFPNHPFKVRDDDAMRETVDIAG